MVAGTRPATRTSAARLHRMFVDGAVDESVLRGTALRRLIAESWQRSKAVGVNPDGEAPSGGGMLDELRARNPLSGVMPVIRRLLVDDSPGTMVAVADREGTLLWVEGDGASMRRAAAMNFAPGANWSESAAGTNAPGTALALDTEVQISGSEHFARLAHGWNCTAVPIHDPLTRAPIGVLDVTGGPQAATPQALSLVRAAAMAVEGQLAVMRLTAAPPAPSARLRLLGGRPRLEMNGRNVPLTGRHADILALLLRHREGLTADHLALLLDERDLDVVTVRAEISRLRKSIGAEFLGSRPYRLLGPIASDADEVAVAVREGRVADALAAYPGPLLPQSVAPGVARLRTELSEALRAAVLATRDLGLLRRWLDLPEGRDDRAAWEVLHRGSTGIARAEANGRLAGLDLDLA
ncbi:GAF domain-containing protein [Tsukamurella paurometabola]|uniref:Putative phytochrome sensor protein n=1 Tax=Tsukamurella paurometabola (strain ATCC 8368 / DSM 20162 / CCUG 35730 / CIP 100753 / JCM 10117 / KCTC 9821 / NBRC 16120 / NCIMB 702349 / NCTC 13040) TaxID=521096 RepID=D5UND2_TSUPD|nr:helix-turn-helix domain-containing protein [Tsukamurella paurometabola]ADG80627.1 putative phytochrome sensor protein [Tsukamurella paurometabola DSM 20162]